MTQLLCLRWLAARCHPLASVWKRAPGASARDPTSSLSNAVPCRHHAVSPGALALLARLSTREREVAMKIREGQRTAEIAHDFHRSPLTIKSQLTSIFTKLGVKSRAQVAALLNR